MSSKATAITGTSDSVMDEYGYDKPPFSVKRISPAYCGFDTSRFKYDAHAKATLCDELGWNNDVNIALFVGRIGLQSYDTAANQKNPEFAFEVAKQLVADDKWRFVFVGYKGDTGDRMEREAQKQFGGRIKFLGLRQDVPQIMCACDVFIFPSLWEGLGMVAVEAQSAGMKVVMSDAVPKEAIVCPELVTIKKLDDGIDSWVIEVKDGIKPSNRSVYAEVVRQSPFSIENSVKKLLALYEG
jgi:glycosyltransferase EpsF